MWVCFRALQLTLWISNSQNLINLYRNWVGQIVSVKDPVLIKWYLSKSPAIFCKLLLLFWCWLFLWTSLALHCMLFHKRYYIQSRTINNFHVFTTNCMLWQITSCGFISFLHRVVIFYSGEEMTVGGLQTGREVGGKTSSQVLIPKDFLFLWKFIILFLLAVGLLHCTVLGKRSCSYRTGKTIILSIQVALCSFLAVKWALNVVVNS